MLARKDRKLTDEIQTVQLMSAGQIRACLGDISDMTLWRICHNKSLEFPRCIKINRRRYWQKSEFNAWIQKMAARRQ